MSEQRELPGIPTHKPMRYSQMCAARSKKEVDAAIAAFYEDLEAIRLKHAIADVHVILRFIIQIYEEPDGELPAVGSMHIGAIQEAEGMCAWAYAKASEVRRDFVDSQKSQGIQSARKGRGKP